MVRRVAFWPPCTMQYFHTYRWGKKDVAGATHVCSIFRFLPRQKLNQTQHRTSVFFPTGQYKLEIAAERTFMKSKQ